MRTLFEAIIAEGERALESLVQERQQESVELDFKSKSNPANGDWDKTDRQTFAKALSAFANSMGGLIVYGVDARPDESGVDAAVELQPISELSAFASRAQTLCGQLIMPRHDGILIHPVPSAELPDTGYLAVWVERSDRRPHRSEAGEKQYYKRAGSNSFAMEHFDIEDAFNRIAPAELSVGWSASWQGSRTTEKRRFELVRITLELTNDSRVSATMPYLRIVSSNIAPIDPFGLDGNRNHGLPWARWDKTLFAGGMDDAIHPGQVRPVTALRLEIQIDDDDEWIINGQREPVIEISYECGCANSRMQAGSLSISARDLRDVL